jgi:Raf kinase inhibitor-like YbhB/YbcL family protein
MALSIADLRIDSPAFPDGGAIPDRYSRYHDDVVPPLRWSGVPQGTRQLALVCHDPDAPLPDGWTHWVVYGIAPDVTGIDEGGPVPGVKGTTSYGDVGWGGPMPPPGHGTHRYYFWVYALDTEIDAGPGLTRQELFTLMDGHILEQARTTGTYIRAA